MDRNDNNSQDEAGPSKTPDNNQDRDNEMETGPSTSRNRQGMEIDQSDDSDNDSFDAGDNGGQVRNLYTTPRLVNGHLSDYIDDSDSDSSSSDSRSMYVVPRYVSPNSPNYPNIHVPENEPLPYINDLNFTPGYYILVTNIIGGWNKNQVKRFFRTHFGVECRKSRPYPGVHLTAADFLIMFNFRCMEVREFVILYLAINNLHNCFNYIPKDQIPEGSLESDSDDNNVT